MQREPILSTSERLEINTLTMTFFHILLSLLKTMMLDVAPKDIKTMIEGDITEGRSVLKYTLNIWLKEKCVKAEESLVEMSKCRSEKPSGLKCL